MKKTINLKDLDLTKLKTVKTPDINDLLCSNQLFNNLLCNLWVDEDDEIHNVIKQYVAYNWYCTDSIVGTYIYTFKGELLCYSQRNGRKCDNNFTYFSKEMYDKLQQYYLDYVLKLTVDNECEPTIKTVDETSVDLYYQIEHTSQLLLGNDDVHKYAMYDGELVKIISVAPKNDESDWISRHVYISQKIGDETIVGKVELCKLYFPIYEIDEDEKHL